MKKKIVELISYFEPRAWWRDKLTDQILAAFKAHIEECKRPSNPNKNYIVDMPVVVEDKLINIAYMAWESGVEADRKALMESLE